MSVNRHIIPAAIFVLLLATLLRFHLLDAQSFWNDEGNSARLSERTFLAILEGTASDIHPPLYYLLLRGWREFVGETEFGLRSFSVYAGILTVAGVMALARRKNFSQWLHGGRTPRKKERIERSARLAAFELIPPAVAGMLAAFSPVLVYYSQETRMYALLGLLAVMSAWALFNWMDSRGRFGSLAWAGAYSILLAAGLYTHYFFPAVIAAQGAVVFLRTVAGSAGPDAPSGDKRARFNQFAAWIGMVVISLLFYSPWVPIFLRQIGGRAGTPTSLAALLEGNGRWLFLGHTIAPGEAAWALAAAVALVFLGVLWGRRYSMVVVILAVVPIAIMFLAGATDPAFFKFLLAVVPFLMVLMGLAWHSQERWAVVPMALTVVVIAGSLLSLGNLYYDPAFARADYRGISARIASENHPNAAIILNAPNQWEVFTYYHKDGAPVYPLPRSQPDPAILEPELEEIVSDHDRLYALYWGDAQRDPNHVVERWLDSNTFVISEEWVGDVRFVIYVSPNEAAAEPIRSKAPFIGLDHETITLDKFAVWPTVARPGDSIQVQLTWLSDMPTARPYKVFLHLLDSAGAPVSQRDSEPVGGFRPTTGWQPGEIIVDNHGIILPSGLPPGEYRLRLGLYDVYDPAARLEVNSEDSLLLATIVVQ